MFEGWWEPPTVFTGTIHRNSCGCYGEPNEFNANNWQPRRVNLTRRFHTYAMRWTPARVTWFLDQRRIMSWPVFDTTNTRMFLLFTMYIGGQSLPDGSTPNELHTKVNWVRVWQSADAFGHGEIPRSGVGKDPARAEKTGHEADRRAARPRLRLQFPSRPTMQRPQSRRVQALRRHLRRRGPSESILRIWQAAAHQSRLTTGEAGVRSLRRRRFGRLGHGGETALPRREWNVERPAVFLTEEWPSNPLTWERRPAAVGGPATTRAGSQATAGWNGT